MLQLFNLDYEQSHGLLSSMDSVHNIQERKIQAADVLLNIPSFSVISTLQGEGSAIAGPVGV